ncbi:MAG: penicillin-binding protein 1C [Candidatus Cloacimonetes bacterium]|nr:penicillin-binding protein 1C [Candidatus Cloacimonadota bacterium]
MLNKLKQLPLLLRIILIAGAVFLLIFIVIPLPNPKDTPAGTVILDCNGDILRIFTNQDEQFLFPLESDQSIPLKVKTCILNYEDRNFYKHPGVNPISLYRAFKLNLREKRIVSGGSTITMQAVSLLQPRPRNYFYKTLEILTALKFELFHKKETILLTYCNNAPYGSNIIGIRTASYKYFGKDMTRLTWAESALLAVLPNAPGAIFPGKGQEALQAKRDRLLASLNQRGFISNETFKAALWEPLPQGIKSFPFHAPHLGRRLHNKAEGKIWHTTIDRKLQQQVETLSHRIKHNFETQGIRNYSILVTDRRTGAVKVYLGSQDFRDNDRQGQIDGVFAPRSTGSILKPFLYGSAIDEGMIVPQTLLPDRKLHYMLFAPENYDFGYRGVVSAEDALRKSYNIPAVQLLERYGVYKFTNLLRDGGITTLFRTPEDYGLSLVIGGAEATLWDVSRLYQELANYGQSPDIHYLAEDNTSPVNISISEGACWLTLEMLKNNNFAPYELSGKKPIALKTGTSFGFRDAWAVGVSADWVISVWTGNFTGESNPGIVSFTAAVPILKSVYSILPSTSEQEWFYKPEASLRKQAICAETGYYPGAVCPDTLWIDVPVTAKPLPTCPYHVTRVVDEKSGYAVCSRCWQGMKTEKKTFLEFPPSITAILKNMNCDFKLAPEHNPACPVANSYLKPEIIYPIQGANIMLPTDFGGVKQNLVLRAEHSSKDVTIFWYLDGKSIGETRDNHSIPVQPEPGEHLLEIVDSNGSSAEVRFSVK